MHVLRIVDVFSWFIVEGNAAKVFGTSIPSCYKGVEIDTANNTVYDAEIKHGVAQLQYSLPDLFVQTAKDLFTSNIGDSEAFGFCPILLTTADLYVARETFSVKAVEAGEKLEDFAYKVPYLVLTSGIGHDFQQHAKPRLEELEEITDSSTAMLLTSLRLQQGARASETLGSVVRGLLQGTQPQYDVLFGTVLVCTYENFMQLVGELKTAFGECLQSSKQLSQKPK